MSINVAIDSELNSEFYLIYRFTGFSDTVIDDDGEELPIVHAVKCDNLIEAIHAWEHKVCNFTGTPELLGFLSDIGYLSLAYYLLDDDLTD